MAILRKVLSVGAGSIAAGTAIAGVETVGHARVEGDAVFGVAIVGYGLGAMLGAFIAARMADRLCSIIVAGLLGLLATINLFSFAHPLWFAPTAAGIIGLGWAVGYRAAGLGRDQGGEAA